MECHVWFEGLERPPPSCRLFGEDCAHNPFFLCHPTEISLAVALPLLSDSGTETSTMAIKKIYS